MECLECGQTYSTNDMATAKQCNECARAEYETERLSASIDFYEQERARQRGKGDGRQD